MKRDNKFLMPDIIGMDIDKAKKILDEKGILYEDEVESKFSFKAKGTVIKTEPKYEERLNKDTKVKMYQSNGILLLLLPLFLLFLLFGGTFTVSNIIYNTRITPPELIVEPELEEGKTWRHDAIVKVSKDSKSNYKITHYDYCIKKEKNTNGCEWKKTYTKNVEVFDNGHIYVFMRGVDERNHKSKPAFVDVYIDNNAPVIDAIKVTKVTGDSISIHVDAHDDLSDIKYYYSLDGKNYVEDDFDHIFRDLKPNTTYTIYVQIVDEAGNSTIGTIKVKTESTNKDEGGIIKGSTDDNPEDPNDPNNPNNPNNPNEPNNPNNPINEWDIPKIGLDDVPAIFKFGDKYDLPSWVDFGNDEGTYECTVSGTKYESTETLPIGNHTIICTATSKHDKTATVMKDIKIEVPEGVDEMLDGWLYYNLYYPEGSYNWQWRLDGVDGIRTGYDGTDWQDYTGPILVKVEDIENIYIRYDIDGETYIVAPKGKALVDIEPEKWTLYDSETTKVKIVYDKDATVKEYRINGGTWQNYEGEFEVSANTLVDARVKKNQDIYNNIGDYVTTKVITNYDSAYISIYYDPVNGGPVGPGNPGGPSGPGGPGGGGIPTPPPSPGNPGGPSGPGGIPLPPYPDFYLDGPTITANPTTQGIEYTTVSITAAYPGTIYYSEDGSAWKVYSGEFDVDKNETISAYYIRDDDGVVSRTSKYRVNFIKAKNVPYVGITASPADYLYGNNDSVTVSINASDYDAGTLEYSFNNIVFEKYTAPFEVDKSTTIYARASNAYGYGYDSLTITTKTPPVKKESLNVSIIADPAKDKVNGLANKVNVTINYDSRATIKKYTIDGKTWNDYTGPFILDRNATITAYCSNTNGEGSAELLVDYLTLGIARPIIKANTEDVSYQVQVSVEYDENASKKLYRIDGGEWIDYEGPFIVKEKCIIEAYNENVLGYKASSMIKIDNIVPEPQYTILEENMYYIIKPNYPNTSVEDTREYKWQEDGTWKKYNGIAIILIKPEYNGKLNITDGIKVTIDGTEYIFTDHYYQLERPLYQEIDNLFIRWNNVQPKAPSIIFDTEDPAKEVNVTISYGPTLVRRQYMLVSPDGTSTKWLDYTGPIKVTENNTVIYARGFTRTEYGSEVSTKTVTNIDSVNPTISVSGDLTTPKRQVQLRVSANDNLGIDQVRWIKGEYDEAKYDEASFIPNNSVVSVNEKGKYTFYAKDKAGNVVFKVVDVTNVDLDAPNVTINILTKETKADVEVSIDYGDSTTKQYSIGNQNNYKNYDGNFFIKSLDVYNLANQDGSITIYAKGTDSAGNVAVVSEKIYNLDLNIFSEPVITPANKYGLITKKEIKLFNYATVTYDNTRDDIINEVKVGNGDYSVYTKEVYVDGETVYARSRNPQTGLEREVSQYVTVPADGVKYSAYDKNIETYDTVPANNKRRLDVDNDGSYKQILVRSSSEGEGRVYIYGPTGDKIDEVVLDPETPITLESGVTKIEIVAGNKELKVYEIEFIQVVRPIKGDSILSIMQNNPNLSEGSYIFQVKQEEYRIHLIVKDGNQVITENTQYGDSKDIGTASSYAKNMVIVKINGDYTVNEGVTVGPIYTKYGGPKGLMLYVTGKLTNNGTIDNSHGAYAHGQDIYLWKNSNGSYETIPATGAGGGSPSGGNGKDALTVNSRATGGGGSGITSYTGASGGRGSAGTSYSGGSGGGAAHVATGTAGIDNGGAGGNADRNYGSGGGAGNPGGSGTNNGANGTGGLLIIYSNEYENNGDIIAKGSKGGQPSNGYNGGSSGGGSINIFTNQSTGINQTGVETTARYSEILGRIDITGGTNSSGSGGAGTVNIGEIRNGTYYDLRDAIDQDKNSFDNRYTVRGDSILSILRDNNLSDGYYSFVANGETYPVHLYVYNGDQIFAEDKTFGDKNDVSRDVSKTTLSDAYRAYASNMVIVKVNGNLTVNEGVKISPYSTSYGGPKGFTIYVSGKLTNNGTIDNTHGAYALGQNVHLWKNNDGSYETVPATGAIGGSPSGGTGKDALTVSKRATGGGGAGTTSYTGATGGKGSTGTSYSGGAGGGAAHVEYGGNAGDNGGAGGKCDGTYGSGAGAGNPGGKGVVAGANGTGGLLTIYSYEYENNGYVLATGSNGGVYSGNGYNGGSSGGGSINIFYNTIKSVGNIFANGGRNGNGGAGGQGSITYTRTTPITGDSILNVIKDNDLSSGYYSFNINGEEYSIHLYTLEGNQVFAEDQVFGTDSDISINVPATSTSNSYRTYSRNMVVVKVKGDLTINENVLVRPHYNSLGGPKGFMLYVTGSLNNNGTIDNSHGAYALGQDVYLLKNNDGSYEYVPAAGAGGGSPSGGGGKAGSSVNKRATGGGSAGVSYLGTAGSGAAGTSYSGGSGGGASHASNGSNGSPNGGQGGSNNSSYGSGGGAGNPGGSGASANGKNGTGGLLIIYANLYNNNGHVYAKGSSGGVYSGNNINGGSSGGGSINIFYNYVDSTGDANADGGTVPGGPYGSSQPGGQGTINYTKINDYLGTSRINNSESKLNLIKSLLPRIVFNEAINKYDIEFREGYKNEYSLDLGKTWTEYTESLDIDKNCTIMARVVDEVGNVVSSSSYTITRFDNENKSEKQEEIAEVKNTINNAPVISINELGLSYAKTINIEFNDDYNHQYSLDLGETWFDYRTSIITDSDYIIARSVDDNNNVITSSSYTITKLIRDNNEEEGNN